MEFWLHGTEATLHLDVLKKQLRLIRRDGGAEDVVPAVKEGWRVEEEFVGAIRGTETVCLTDFVTGLRYMEFTSAVAQSLRTRQAVGLPIA